MTFVASTGDYGAADPVYPAFSPNVLAVGGTSLSLNADNSYNSETGWGYHSDSMGRLSAPAAGSACTNPNRRTSRASRPPAAEPPPMSPSSPIRPPGPGSPTRTISVPSNPWEVVGGTSLSAPCWAGLIALANQGRAAAGQPALDSFSPTETQQDLYNLSQSDYHVIASGSNGYNAGRVTIWSRAWGRRWPISWYLTW